MKARLIVTTIVVGGVALAIGGAIALAGKPASTALYPDLRTVVPAHLNLVNQQQQDILRFSNGIANTGEGPWRMRPEFPPAGTNETQKAIQEVLASTDSSGCIVFEAPVSEFEFHEEHNHWHIDDVALFEIRKPDASGAAPDMTEDGVVGGRSVKTTFCLIDWIRIEGNTNTGVKSDRTYFECEGAYQGVSVGWIDQYHQATEGQQLDVTGVPAGRYFLVSTANPEGVFIESDGTNNTAWVSFDLKRDGNGNPKIALVGHSECEPGLCADNSANR